MKLLILPKTETEKDEIKAKEVKFIKESLEEILKTSKLPQEISTILQNHKIICKEDLHEKLQEIIEEEKIELV